MRNCLNQAHIARECTQWLSDKVETKSFKKPYPAQQRVIYIENKEVDISNNGTVDFSPTA